MLRQLVGQNKATEAVSLVSDHQNNHQQSLATLAILLKAWCGFCTCEKLSGGEIGCLGRNDREPQHPCFTSVLKNFIQCHFLFGSHLISCNVPTVAVQERHKMLPRKHNFLSLKQLWETEVWSVELQYRLLSVSINLPIVFLITQYLI